MMTLLAIGLPQGMEWVIIFLAVLLIFGPKALPKLARSLGSSLREFKNATNKVTDTLMEENDEEEEAPPRLRRPKDQVEEARKTEGPILERDEKPEKASSKPS